MKRVFKLNGLDCANCAAKMEAAIGKTSGVKNVSINFMTAKMTLEAGDDEMNEVVSAAFAIIKKLEPQVEIKKA